MNIMKINWGHKILIVYLLFVGGIGFLAIISSQQKFDLVLKDYYGAELKYQEVIDASARAKQLTGGIKLLVNNKTLIIQFPETFKDKEVIGVAHLYFAADQNKDFTQNINGANAKVSIPLLQNMKGNYTLKLDLVKEGVSYYYEQKIFL
jgi:hypothetical protein